MWGIDKKDKAHFLIFISNHDFFLEKCPKNHLPIRDSKVAIVVFFFLHCLIFYSYFFLGSYRLSASNHYEAEKNIRNVTRDSLRQSYRTMVVRHPFERILSGYLWSIASDEGKILPTLPLDFRILKNF